MRSLRRDCKGQFVIIVALLIASLTLALAISVHQINLHKQELRYQPVNEYLLGVTSDMERALSKALSKYTYSLLKGDSAQTANEFGVQFMSNWKKAVFTSYATLDQRMVHENLIFGSNWNGPVGFSSARVEYKIDVNGYGFEGWNGRVAKYVRLEFFPDSVDLTAPGQTSLKFQLTQSAVNQNEMIPISNLSPELLFIDSLPLDNSLHSLVDSLSYLGNGKYLATTKERINPNTLGVLLTVVTPDDEIWVQASNYQPIYLTLNTREENGTSTNLGQIRFMDKTYPADGAFDTQIPVTPSFESVPYYLEFTPPEGYSFVRWETNSAFVTVQDSLSIITGATVEGNGTITAVYAAGNNPVTTNDYADILLDSREWNSTSFHEGQINFNTTTPYNLPQTLTNASTGFYLLGYIPKNSSYGFYGWEFSGSVALVGSYTQNTTVRVYGNASITALYMFTPDNGGGGDGGGGNGGGGGFTPGGEWNSLYFDDKRTLVPGYLWSGHDGHDETHSSTGNMKQTTTLATPIPCPDIQCAQKINLTIFITPVPPQSVKSLDLELGFNFNGYHKIGNFTFEPINATTTVYKATIDIDNTDWGYGPRVIPAGSIIQLTMTVSFLQKNGFDFVYHGYDNPSCIDLF